MKKPSYIFISLLFFFSLSSSLKFLDEKEPESKKLSGTPICSDGPSSKTLKNAFTEDYSEEFISSSSSNGWVGLELSSPHRITQIGFAQRSSDSSSYILGIFEGSNDALFTDTYPLYMIKEEITPKKMNYIKPKVNYSFKYVRYVGPHNKTSVISGLEFYGYPSEISLSEDEEEILYQPTNLPLIIIHTDSNEDPEDKETDVNCTIKIINDNKRDLKASATIKLRGNSSLRKAKRPYKIKFDSKQKILDFPSKAKKWNLLANFNDKTLIRNALTFKISEMFELKYTPVCKFVDVMINGEYKGNFNLCDKVEVKKGRMELDELDETCNEEPEITGGYLIEATGYARDDEIYGESSKGILYSIRYPDRDKITLDQLDYLNNFVNKVEEEVYSGIVDNIDEESFVKFLIIQEMAANADGMWSDYMYKEREDDKLYFGPIWDFDLSFGNDRRAYPLSSKTNFMFKYSLNAGTMISFVTKILNNEKMLHSFKEKWKEISESDIKNILFDFIDKQTEYIKESRKLNFKRWDILKRKVSVNPVCMCTYDKEIQYLKDWIIERFEQLDGMIGNATVEFINQDVRGGMGGWGGMGEGGGFNFNRTQFNFTNFNFTNFNWTFPGQGGQGGGNTNHTHHGGFDWGNFNRPGNEENLGQIDESCIGVEDEDEDNSN